MRIFDKLFDVVLHLLVKKASLECIHVFSIREYHKFRSVQVTCDRYLLNNLQVRSGPVSAGQKQV